MERHSEQVWYCSASFCALRVSVSAAEKRRAHLYAREREGSSLQVHRQPSALVFAPYWRQGVACRPRSMQYGCAAQAASLHNGAWTRK